MAEYPSDALNLPQLQGWLVEHAAADSSEPLTVELATNGRSNLTFFVSQPGRQWVLRRPPLGPVLPSANDMAREFRVQQALQHSDVPVPQMVGLCLDTDVVGAPFYVMSRMPGTPLRTSLDIVGLDAPALRELSMQLVDVLCRIHSVDWLALGLHDYGRPRGYLERQVHRWADQWRRSTTRDVPAMDALLSHLLQSLPAESPGALVHGDFRLDNVLFTLRPDVAPSAVLDWEMSTVGDPLADLGLLLVYWPDASDPLPPPSVAPQFERGTPFLTRGELVERYAQSTSLELRGLPYYVMFAYFKLAVILEGLYRRFQVGRVVGEGYERFADEVPELADRALTVAASGLPGLSDGLLRGGS